MPQPTARPADEAASSGDGQAEQQDGRDEKHEDQIHDQKENHDNLLAI